MKKVIMFAIIALAFFGCSKEEEGAKYERVHSLNIIISEENCDYEIKHDYSNNYRYQIIYHLKDKYVYKGEWDYLEYTVIDPSGYYSSTNHLVDYSNREGDYEGKFSFMIGGGTSKEEDLKLGYGCTLEIDYYTGDPYWW